MTDPGTDELDALEYTVSAMRQLVEDNPEYRPQLAVWLHKLALMRHDRVRGLAELTEAIEIYQSFAADDPATYGPTYVGFVADLSQQLVMQGDTEGGASVARQAIRHARELPAEHSPKARAMLARALLTFADRLHERNQAPDAVPAALEAVHILRDLATVGFFPQQSDLARGMSKLARIQAASGHADEAAASADEALSLAQALVDAGHDRYVTDVADALAARRDALIAAGRNDDALDVVDEVVDLFRTHAEQRPDRYLPWLAMAYDNVAYWRYKLGRRDSVAHQAAADAVAVYRLLLEADGGEVHLASAAMALNNLGNCRADAGRPGEAADLQRGAVELYRRLAATDPDRHRLNLATLLENWARSLTEAGRHDEAATVTAEAAQLGST